MVEEIREIDGLIDEQYVPSSVERKKAVLMYFFVGIVVALSKEKISYYELFHLKQAMGWRTTFFICMVFGIIFIFIPYYLWLIPLILFLCYMVFWVIFVKQAREGRYTVDEDKILLPFFAGIGGWIVSVFEIEVVHEDNEVDES